VTAGAPRRAVLSIPVLRAEVEARGKTHSFLILGFRQAVPPPDIAARMAPLPGGPLFWIETLHMADDAPFALERRWLNPAAVPGMLPDLTRVTVNEWLLTTVPYATGEIVFSAEPAGEAARVLRCAAQAALFVVERVTRTTAGPVTHVRLLHAPGYRMTTAI
jgi:GntR family histidine utilization transcriptional repressor